MLFITACTNNAGSEINMSEFIKAPETTTAKPITTTTPTSATIPPTTTLPTIENLLPPEGVYNPESDFIYEIVGDEVTIIKYIGESEIVSIPPTIEGKNVVALDVEANHVCEKSFFLACTFPRVSAFPDHVRAVIIPDTVIKIGHHTFMDNFNLEYVYIPESVHYIKDLAFFGCKNLINVTLPSNLKFLGNAAFALCSKLEHINLPIINDGIIPSNTFVKCASLTYIEIPYGIIQIDEYAFGETNLIYIEIPDSVKKIHSHAFINNRNLQTVIFPVDALVARNAFDGCDNLDEETLGRIEEVKERGGWR
jgi:hypothetical protein